MEQQLRLAGINYSIMHGMAVILLLGYLAEDHPTKKTEHLRTSLSSAGTNVSIPVDEWQTCTQLGHACRYPLLRVRLRSQDRPGAIRDLLDTLGSYIREEFPSIKGQINTWYAQSDIMAGHEAFTRLNAPLPIQDGRARDWSKNKIEEFRRKLGKIEHEVRRSASRAAASQMSSFTERPGVTGEPVVSIIFIEAPAEPA